MEEDGPPRRDRAGRSNEKGKGEGGREWEDEDRRGGREGRCKMVGARWRGTKFIPMEARYGYAKQGRRFQEDVVV